MKINEIIVESSRTAGAEQVWDYVRKIHPDDQQGGGFLKRLIMRHPQYELKRIPLSSLHIPDQELDDEEQPEPYDPYGRAMFVDPDHAGEYSMHHIDTRPIVIDTRGNILDGSHRAWAAAELMNKKDIMAYVPVMQIREQGVTEAFDQPYSVQWTKKNGDWHATADLDDGSELIVLFMSQGDNQWMVEFERDENMEITGEGDAPRVFATVLLAMQQFIAKRKPAMLNFSAEKEDDPTGSRARLYDRMIQRYITGTGYDLTRKDYPGGATYTLTKQVQGVAENIPQPGESSGAPKKFGPDAKIQTRQMTVKQIISSVPGLPYYNNVVDDWDAKDYSWGVTKKVIEYATYLKQHPESLSQLPPILVLNGKFEDGAHRVSAIWLLQQRMDPKNPLWANAKLNVQFVKQGMAENASGIDFDMTFDDDTGSFATVTARAQGRVLGSVKFFMDGDTLEADMVEVDERYRGQGIAAAMYDYAKAQGYTVEKSDDLTPDGEHFWTKNRGEQAVWENFADGRNPQDKGDAKRHGVPTKASVSTLRKVAKQGGRKGQLAHWMANMKAGKAKKNG